MRFHSLTNCIDKRNGAGGTEGGKPTTTTIKPQTPGGHSWVQSQLCSWCLCKERWQLLHLPQHLTEELVARGWRQAWHFALAEPTAWPLIYMTSS